MKKFKISSTNKEPIGVITWRPDGLFSFEANAEITVENKRGMERAMQSIKKAGNCISHSHYGRKPGDLWAKSYKTTDESSSQIVSAIIKARSLLRDYIVEGSNTE